jgi:zinc transport system substrate-binding protein
MKKKIGVIALCYIILIVIIIGFVYIFGEKTASYDDSKIQVVVTLYPEYDFVSKVGGDKVQIKRLIEAGVEVHTYEPSVKDMKKISDSDMFVYTCASMEPWVETILNSVDTSKTYVVDSSENVDLIELDGFMEEYNALDEVTSSHNEAEYEYDGHIWMNPQNAIKMVNSITDSLSYIDPENTEYYKANARDFIEQIEALDEEIKEALIKNNVTTLVFGGEFSYAYFCEHYNLKAVTVYDACGEGAEPSVSKIKKVIDYINSNKITKVFYEELSEGTVANMISEETLATPLVFNTLHNVSKAEVEQGVDYCTIMRENLEKIIGK